MLLDKVVDRFGIGGRNMKTFKTYLSLLALAVVGTLVGCSTASTKAASVSDSMRAALDQAGFKDVSAIQDRDKGIITLGGHVARDGDKAQAESIAKSIAGTQVVANQIAVIPPGVESEAKTVNADLDRGIESNLDAALIMDNLHQGVKYAVKNHVVTLTGEVDSQDKRARAEAVASAVPNVQQVVNVLQVKDQKATSTR
jgi:osmotically-inducible protein OsmY